MTNSRSKQAIFMNFGYINNHITLRGSLDSSEVVESEVGQPLQEDQRQHHSTPGELYRWCHTWRKSTAGDQGGISFPKPRTEAGKAGLHQERRQAASGPSLAPCQRNPGRPEKTRLAVAGGGGEGKVSWCPDNIFLQVWVKMSIHLLNLTKSQTKLQIIASIP